MQSLVFPWLGGAASLFMLAACAGGATGDGSAPMAAAPPAEARCDAQAAQSFVGQAVTSDTLGRVRAATGAQEVRQLRPDSMITKEFKLGRVNVVVDASQRVVRVYCG
ncbi:I78 family peptidase inhibitor [Ottowia flava]|uniref:I78 family peptidase inhibitor n=1 Tax=Ottowia flava TaxID=2675430 RepID=A0ABW4KPV1_9BURK|nr:I78 family peptidase inhibitor [Ottowia sp. GY511]